VIVLDVPYNERDLAKSLGARWNPDKKHWYAPDGSQIAKIADWIPTKTIEKPVTISPSEAWEMLPPRSNDPSRILGFLKERPAKVKYGFCSMCDSTVHDTWCIGSTRTPCELRHLAHLDPGILRPSELTILLAALEAGTV